VGTAPLNPDEIVLFSVVYSAMLLKRNLHSAVFLRVLRASCRAQVNDEVTDSGKVAAKSARVLHLLDANRIAWQTQTPKVDVGGGGTIGSFLSMRNMEVFDVGIPLLSMHATYEMSSKVDVWSYYRFMLAFYTME